MPALRGVLHLCAAAQWTAALTWDTSGAYAGLGDASNATTWARVVAVDAWLRRGGPQPAHWAARGRGALGDGWAPLSNASAKTVWRTTLGGTSPVVVKALVDHARSYGSAHSRDHAREAHVTEIASEILYLELCRGLPGVPALHGGWLDAAGRPSYVVAAAGDRITTSPVGRYAALARSRPLDLAAALLECFWSFSERGGFFLDDFALSQFAYAVGSDEAVGSDGAITVSLVDAPKILAPSPAYDLLSSFPRPHAIDAAPRPCAGGDACPISHRSHCCCCEGGGGSPCAPPPCKAGSRGAPESKGLCKKGLCAPLSSATHAFDVAARAWALPFVTAASGRGKSRDARRATAFLKDLTRRLAAYDAASRPSLSDALGAVARFRRGDFSRPRAK